MGVYQNGNILNFDHFVKKMVTFVKNGDIQNVTILVYARTGGFQMLKYRKNRFIRKNIQLWFQLSEFRQVLF